MEPTGSSFLFLCRSLRYVVFPHGFVASVMPRTLKYFYDATLPKFFRVAQLRGETPTANVEQSVPLPHEWTAVLVLPPDSNVEHFADGANGFEESDVGGLRFCFASDVKTRVFLAEEISLRVFIRARGILRRRRSVESLSFNSRHK